MNASKPRRSKFWGIYLIVVVVILAIIAGALFYLWQMMGAYEESTPEYALQSLDTVFSADQYEVLAQNAGIENSPYEPNDVRSAALQEELNGGELQSARMAGGSSETEQSYQVKAGDTVIGSFTLAYADEGMFGYWQIVQPQINPSMWGEVTVRVPSTAQLFVNGTAAGEETVLQTSLPYQMLNKLPEDIVQPVQTEYQISNLTSAPQLSAIDENGMELSIVLQDEAPWPLEYVDESEQEVAAQHYGATTLPQPQEDLAALQEMALQDAENYSRYLSNDNSFTTLAARLLPNSEIYSEMRAMETMFYTPHTSVSFTEAQAGNIQQYNNDIFSIDADYLYTVFRGEDRPYLFDTKVTFVYVRDGDDWRIGDIQIRS